MIGLWYIKQQNYPIVKVALQWNRFYA